MISNGFFFKSELENVMMSLIKDLKASYSMNMKYARQDNAGENTDFERTYKQEGMDAHFKYTMPSTLQHMAN